MFTVQFSNTSPDFLNYISKESISVHDNTVFSFSSFQNCVDVLSRYFLFICREEALNFHKKELQLSDRDLENFELLIPSKDSIELLSMIESAVSSHLKEFQIFQTIPFFTFRLRDEKKAINHVVLKTLDDLIFLSNSDSGLPELRKFINTSAHQIDSLTVFRKQNTIYAFNKNILVFSDEQFNEDFVISQIITINPSKLFIQNKTFSVMASEIVQSVFDERSVFYDKKSEIFSED